MHRPAARRPIRRYANRASGRLRPPARPSLGVPRSGPDRRVNITRDWALAAAAVCDGAVPAPPSPTGVALRAGESNHPPGVPQRAQACRAKLPKPGESVPLMP
jgi:hypothetical protein